MIIVKQEYVLDQAGVPAVAVLKGVDLDQPVVQPHALLENPESIFFLPVFNVVGKLFHFNWYLVKINTEVEIAFPKNTRPFPRSVKHIPVHRAV